MTDLSCLQPDALWRIFSGICRIPHASGNEEKLTRFIAELAGKNGCRARFDAYGNLRVDRAGQNADDAILLQGHLDMVPACAEGKKFDFAKDAVQPVIEGNRVRADGTTLGADDGIGIALALDALFAPELRDVPLGALFTRNEETGLVGAMRLDPEFLRGRALINLDAGEDNVFQIGCAGGLRTNIFFAPGSMPAPEGQGVEISVGNLAGGHSGVDIDKGRANALILLAKLLKNLPYAPADFSGGIADNAIPTSAKSSGIAKVSIEELKMMLLQRAARLQKSMTADREFKVTIASKSVSRIWDPAFAAAFLDALVSAPNGALAFSRNPRAVKSSSNIGQIFSAENSVTLISSQRSVDDRCRDKIARKVCRHFSGIAATWDFSKAYPGWKPETTSLVGVAAKTWKKVNGSDAKFEVVHAGFECGVFRGKAPKLPMIACFPKHGDLHSPSEYVEIDSVGRVRAFLHAFLREI